MNPDSQTGAWMGICLGIDQEQTDYEAAGMTLEVPRNGLFRVCQEECSK